MLGRKKKVTKIDPLNLTSTTEALLTSLVVSNMGQSRFAAAEPFQVKVPGKKNKTTTVELTNSLTRYRRKKNHYEHRLAVHGNNIRTNDKSTVDTSDVTLKFTQVGGATKLVAKQKSLAKSRVIKDYLASSSNHEFGFFKLLQDRHAKQIQQGKFDAVIMRRLLGEDVIDIIIRDDKNSFLTIEERLMLSIEIAKAYEELHALGIVHRDVKGDNMKRHEGKIKIFDFDLSAMADEKNTDVVGTIDYIDNRAPEVLNGSGAVTKSDVYGFALMLQQQIWKNIYYSPVFAELSPQEKIAIADIYYLGLEEKVEDRADMSEMVKQLEAFLEQYRSSARPAVNKL